VGFNLKAALLAVSKMNDHHKNGANLEPTEFDKAARLASVLLDSMSFRNYSGRVALIAGMFFLKKLGYSFGGDILEDHWPESNALGTLRDWFNRVSVKVV
jgi:prophage maintenance system killer protein